MNRLRILHLLAPAPFGGLESVVHSLAAEQTREGHDVHVCAIVDAGSAPHPFVSKLAARGIHSHPLPVAPRAYREERAAVQKLLASVHPDIVHTHGYRADVLHGPAAKRLGFRWVTTSHGFTGGSWKNRLYERLQRRSFRKCDAVVAVSRPMQQQLLAAGIRETRLHWIPNAWAAPVPFLDRQEARRQLGVQPNAFCVGFIGRLGFEKGPDTFLDALALCEEPVTGVLVGEGRMRAALETRAASIRPPRSVRFAGRVDSAGRLIKAFDVVVLSSRTEGTPIVLLEAMAARVPVIATRVGGIPDVVSEREALLTAPDQPSAIAAAVCQTLRDPDLARLRAARAADRLASELNAALWLDRYARVYTGEYGSHH